MAEKIGLEALFLDKDFRKGIENYTKKVQQATKDTDKAATEITKDTEKIGKSWRSSADDVGIASTIMIAALSAVLVKVTLTAARTEELGIVVTRMGQNIGKSAGEMDEYVEGIKSMGITTQAARQATIQMVQAQIDLSHATGLARLAQDAAVIAQIDSSQAFERLITVVQRGSPLMARTLGIVVDFQGAYERMADELGKTTEELTSQEKVQARVQNVMENSAQIAGTYEAAMGSAGKQMRSMSRYTQELSNELGESLLPLMGATVQTATDLLKWALDMDPVLRNTIVQTAAFAAGILAVGKAATVTIPKLIAMTLAMGPVGWAGAILAATAALVIYAKQSEDAHQAEAASLIGTSSSYEIYLDKLDKAELGSYALSESLFEIARGADAAKEGLDALALTEAFRELDLILTQGGTGVGWLDELFAQMNQVGPLIEQNLTSQLAQLIPILDEAHLMVLTDADAVRQLAEETGYVGEEQERWIEIVMMTAQAVLDARFANDELTDSLEDTAGAFDIATEKAEAWARALARTAKVPFVPVKSTAKDFFGLNAEEIEALEKAQKALEKTQKDTLTKMQRNHEQYASALEQLYDQIVSTTERAQEERLRASSRYTAAALRLEEDLNRALADARRKAKQDRIDAVRDLNRDLADLDTKLTENNEKTWASYYASLETLAEQHGQKLKSITEKYAKQRASIEDKYRITPTREEEIESERERLLKRLARGPRFGRTGFMERERQRKILEQLEALKQEELAILAAAEEEEIAAEEIAYQGRQDKAAQRREDELAANQEQIDKEAEQRQLAYDREIEDLRISLERQQEERRRSAKRARDELAENYRAQLAEIERGLNAETQGFRDAYNTQLSDLQTYLNQRTQHWRDHQVAIEGILGISSPSKWMEDIGKQMRMGLDVGFAAPNLATDLQSAVANFGRSANNLAMPGALGGGGSSSTSTVINHNLDFKGTFTKPETERSVRDMLRLTQNMLRMRTMG